MNARNYIYISKYNSRANKRFADDKLYTKHFLESRNIGVAKLYRVITDYQDLRNITAQDFPESFVIKPNHGYGGEGIMVIKKRKDQVFTSISGRRISFEEVFLHCAAILDGKFAISGLSDKVIIEELLLPHEDLAEVSHIGLPDIRILVFNFVPVIAMLRVPTHESEGKANVHLGGIGAGIDMGTGKTIGGVRYNKRTTKFPTGRAIKNFQIPLWKEMLLQAAKIQAATKIGFLAVDFVVSTTGVKVLEVNARAGLMVQIANKVPLRARLEKVKDLKVSSPEKGVEIAKTLFSAKSIAEKQKTDKPLIGLFEAVTFLGEKNEALIAQIDLQAEENTIDQEFFSGEEPIADIVLGGNRLKLPFTPKDFSGKQYKMVLGGKFLQDFYIDPTKAPPVSSVVPHQKTEEKLLKNIDRKVCELDAQIKLLSYFRPLNLEEEKEKFFANPTHSPHFFYKIPEISFAELRRNLAKIPRHCDHPLMPLFLDKIEEIEQKLQLIEARDSQDLMYFSEKLWGKVDEGLYKRALSFIKKTPLQEDPSKILPFSEVIARIEEFLQSHQLKHWHMKILESTVADFQISKKNLFLVKKNAKVTENRLLSLLAHEVETHVYRLENGRRAPLQIFERGTAGYLLTEEGLASYNQVRVGVPLGQKEFWAAHRVIAAFLGKKMSFAELFQYFKNTLHLSNQAAWHSCLKVKRGLQDTNKPITFVKDAIYFAGNEQIQRFLAENPTRMRELYLGKIAIRDIAVLQRWKTPLWETPFLPTLTISK